MRDLITSPRQLGLLAFLWFVPGLSQAEGRYVFPGGTYRLAPFPKHFEPLDRAPFAPDPAHKRVRQADLTHLQSVVRDQGDRGSCAYFAAAGLAEHAIKRHFNGENELNLSEEYLIYYTKAVLYQSPYGDQSRIIDNLRALATGGLLLEEQMPYTGSWFSPGMPCEHEDQDTCARIECFAHLPPSPAQLVGLIRPDSYSMRLGSPCGSGGCQDKIPWIIGNLDAQRSVVVGLPLHQDGWDHVTGEATYSEEQHEFCQEEPDSELCGGHGIVLAGYDLEKRLFRFKNSWGAQWGDSGFGTIGFDYVDTYTQFRSIFTATVSGLDTKLENELPPQPAVVGPEHVIEQDHVREDQLGLQFGLTYRYTAPIGSYYAMGLWPVLRDPETNTGKPLVYMDENDEQQIVLDFSFRVALEAEDLLWTPEKPFEFFVPYERLFAAGVISASELYASVSLFHMSDTTSYLPVFRHAYPLPLPESYPCQLAPSSWAGGCSGQVAIWCEGAQATRVDCQKQGEACALNGESGRVGCVPLPAEPQPEEPDGSF